MLGPHWTLSLWFNLETWVSERNPRSSHDRIVCMWKRYLLCACWVNRSAQLYVSFLATVAVIGSPRWSSIASVHMSFVLLSTFGVFFYRDIFPLATYTRIPLDLLEGSLLWIKISFLTLTSIVIPLLVPRQYIAVNSNVGFLVVIPEIVSHNTQGPYGKSQSRTDCITAFADRLFIPRSNRLFGVQNTSFVTRPTSTIVWLWLCQKFKV